MLPGKGRLPMDVREVCVAFSIGIIPSDRLPESEAVNQKGWLEGWCLGAPSSLYAYKI